MQETPGSIPGLGRSPGEGNGNPLQYLAWKISWTEEPGGLQSMGSQRVGHNWATNTHLLCVIYKTTTLTCYQQAFEDLIDNEKLEAPPKNLALTCLIDPFQTTCPATACPLLLLDSAQRFCPRQWMWWKPDLLTLHQDSTQVCPTAQGWCSLGKGRQLFSKGRMCSSVSAMLCSGILWATGGAISSNNWQLSSLRMCSVLSVYFSLP